MRQALVFQKKILAGSLEELAGEQYRFTYSEDYRGEPVSLAMPCSQMIYEFQGFPPLFDGLLPEGVMLEALLKRNKIDRRDLLGQLLAVGEDVVGSLTIRAVE